MAKYDPRHIFLISHHANEITLPFGELEQILDARLPPSAHKYREWWANEREGMHTHAQAWMEAGWLVDTVNLEQKWVRFVRAVRLGGRADADAAGANQRETTPKAWLRIDELENAIDYLEMAEHFLEKLPSLIRWKWIFIAVHQALYGFAICAIQGTDPRHRVLRSGGKLIDIWEALGRCEDPAWMRQYTDSRTLVRSPEEETAIKYLVEEFRNNFEHFTPMSWSINVTGLPLMFGHVLRVIRFLALESNNVFFKEDSQRVRVEQALTRLGDGLNRMISDGG